MTTPDPPPVRLEGLRKEFGHVVAVDGLDLTVPAGSVFGFLGPNGAGKTTTMRIMLGLIRKTSGTVEIFGRDPGVEGVAALEGVAGFVEAPMFYPYLSARKNLQLLTDLDRGADRGAGHGAGHGASGTGDAGRIDDVLATVELDGRGDDRVGGYSQGMRQRLGLAAALLREPRLLMIDEPTNGLDPGGMRDMRRLIADLAGDGLTVLLSSHMMAEVEHLCTDLAIVAKGRVRFTGTLDELRADHGGWDLRLRVTDPAAALATATARSGVEARLEESGELLVRADEDTAAGLSIELGRAGVGIYSMLPDTPSLERLFFELTEADPRATAQGGTP